MNQGYSTFRSRVQRIERGRRNGVGQTLVLQSDGHVVPRQRHLRFGFPLRGLVTAFAIAVVLKAYLIWLLGLENYSAEVVALLNGTSFQQAAARILMPDQLSMWVAGQFEALAAQVTAWRAGV